VKKHLAEDAAFAAVEEPGLDQGSAEQRNQKRGNDCGRKFISHERQMPERPDRRENQAGDEGRTLFLQARQRESSPARFFAEPDEKKNEDETIRQFAPRRF